MMSGLIAALLAIGVAVSGLYLYSPVPEGAMVDDWKILSIVGVMGKVNKFPNWLLQTLGNNFWWANWMRGQMKLFGFLIPAKDTDDVKSSDTTYAGVPVRVYVPTVRKGNGAVLYMHGGGWVIGTLDSSHGPLVELASKLQRVIVSIDYRLAPDHPFPAAPDDCEAAVRHFIDEAHSSLQVDPSKVAVAGDSAGGNLAAVVSNRLLKKPAKHPLKAQILIYPVTQMTDFQLSSYRQGQTCELTGSAVLLLTQQMANFFVSYVGLSMKYINVLLANKHVHPSLTSEPQFKLLQKSTLPDEFLNTPIKRSDWEDLKFLEKDLKPEDIKFVQDHMKPIILNPDINPLYFENLKGVPQAYVITCGFDLLRDEGALYVNRLREAGVPTVWAHYPSGIHAIFSLKDTKLGKQVMRELVQYLDETI